MSGIKLPTISAESLDKATFIAKKRPQEFLPCFWVG